MEDEGAGRSWTSVEASPQPASLSLPDTDSLARLLQPPDERQVLFLMSVSCRGGMQVSTSRGPLASAVLCHHLFLWSVILQTFIKQLCVPGNFLDVETVKMLPCSTQSSRK